MSITEQRERLRRARAELEPLVKEDYRVNAILNAITKLEAEALEASRDWNWTSRYFSNGDCLSGFGRH